MPFIAKIVQALGLGLLLVEFLARFPELISCRALMVSLAVFAAGYGLERWAAWRSG